MAAFLSEAWALAPADPVAASFAAAGGEAVLGRVFTGGPDGEVRYTVRISGGAVSYEAGLGDDAEVTLTDTAKNARALLLGELDPNTAFMRGQTKVAGNTGVLLSLLASAKGEAYAAARTVAVAAADL